MTVLKKAAIKSYDPAAHKATVQIAGSLAVWLAAVPVATDIPAAEVVAGRECAVLFFTEDNPDDAVVVTVHGAVPASPSAGAKIQDTDADTSVDTETSADEDKVRIKVFAVERGLFQTASPHVTLTGDVRIDGLLAINGAPQTAEMLRVASPAGNYGTLALIKAQSFTNPTIVTTGSFFYGIIGAPVPVIPASVTGIGLHGLDFTLGVNLSGSSANVAEMAAVICQTLVYSSGGTGSTVTELLGVRIKQPQIQTGTFTVTTAYGIDIANQGGNTKIADAYGLKIGDITTNTGSRRLIEAGPATPNLRLEANAPAVSGDSKLLLAFYDGAAVGLRRVLMGAANSGGAGFRQLLVAN